MRYENMESTQTSFLEVHPASLFPSRELDGQRLILATGGLKCSALYGNTGPVGCLLKTLVASSIWRSTSYSLTWRMKATKSGQLYCQLSPSARPIGGTGASSWLTPSAEDGKRGGDMVMAKKWVQGKKIPSVYQRLRTEILGDWQTPRANSSTGKCVHGDGGPDLQTAVAWTTPVAADAQGSTGGGQTRSLRTDTHGAGGQLNPDWVECLMGFPIGWTK